MENVSSYACQIQKINTPMRSVSYWVLYGLLVLGVSCDKRVDQKSSTITEPDKYDNYIDWAIYRGDKKSNQYSELAQINAANVHKIKPVWDTVVTEVLDVKQNKVTGVRVKNLKTNEERVLDCAGVFVAIGHVPNTQLFKGVIDMDEAGYIKPTRGSETPPRTGSAPRLDRS